VGVAGVLPPGHGRLSATDKLRLIASMTTLAIGELWRASRVTGAWAARDQSAATKAGPTDFVDHRSASPTVGESPVAERESRLSATLRR
jgi:hypothetical protein